MRFSTPIFFNLSNLPEPLTIGLKYFRFRFRRVIRIFRNLPVVCMIPQKFENNHENYGKWQESFKTSSQTDLECRIECEEPGLSGAEECLRHDRRAGQQRSEYRVVRVLKYRVYRYPPNFNLHKHFIGTLQQLLWNRSYASFFEQKEMCRYSY